ncbi:uncharacterized protein VTP21DRAFT_7310 [Calcarisporiella thermophila]|uniref:uncharacterized protein n=1 Tax=Calcarisporiella thermophila TaxID=911321 RepID=UPI0037426731
MSGHRPQFMTYFGALLLALLAAVGLLALRCYPDYTGSSIHYELSIEYQTYLYTFLSTLSILILLGYHYVRREHDLLFLCYTDSLTGLPNRRYFDKRLYMETLKSYHVNSPLTLLFIDIDHLKFINDVYGHGCGDSALKAVARCLRTTLCLEFVVARLGGDEFVVIAPDTTARQAAAIAYRLLAEVRSLKINSFPLSVSIGISELNMLELNPEVLLKMADKALYAAKSLGRNQVHINELF